MEMDTAALGLTVPVCSAMLGVFAMVFLVFVYGTRSVTPPASHFQVFDGNISNDKKSKRPVKKKKLVPSPNGSIKAVRDGGDRVNSSKASSKIGSLESKELVQGKGQKKLKTQEKNAVPCSGRKVPKVVEADYADDGWTKLISKKERKQNKQPVSPKSEKSPKSTGQELSPNTKGEAISKIPAQETKKSAQSRSSAVKSSGAPKEQANPIVDASKVTKGEGVVKSSPKIVNNKDEDLKAKGKKTSPQQIKGKPSPEAILTKYSDKKPQEAKSKEGKGSEGTTAPAKKSLANEDGWIEVKNTSSPVAKKKQTTKEKSSPQKRKERLPLSHKSVHDSTVPSQEPLVAVKVTATEASALPPKSSDGDVGNAKAKGKRKKKSSSPAGAADTNIDNDAMMKSGNIPTKHAQLPQSSGNKMSSHSKDLNPSPTVPEESKKNKKQKNKEPSVASSLSPETKKKMTAPTPKSSVDTNDSPKPVKEKKKKKEPVTEQQKKESVTEKKKEKPSSSVNNEPKNSTVKSQGNSEGNATESSAKTKTSPKQGSEKKKKEPVAEQDKKEPIVERKKEKPTPEVVKHEPKDTATNTPGDSKGDEKWKEAKPIKKKKKVRRDV